MKIALTQAIAAPRAMIFAELSDFEAIEAALSKKVTDLERIKGSGPIEVGDTWRGTVHYHGITISADLRLSELTRPEAYTIVADAESFAAEGRLSLEETAPDESLLSFDCELRPKGLRGRVAIQPIRLIKPKIEAKLQERLAGFSRGIAKRARKAAQVGT